MYKCVYFSIKELVSPVVYNVWGEKAWMFFSETTLKSLDLIRETYKHPIIINNWASNGDLKQCGLRSNMDDMVKSKKTLYLSAHCMAKGFDLHDAHGHNSALWQHCCNLIKLGKAGTFNRIENAKDTPTWVHIDEFQKISKDTIF